MAELTKEVRQAYAQWQAECAANAHRTDYDRQETKRQQTERITRARTDYAFFVEYYFPHICTDRQTGRIVPSAPFHVDAANYIKDHPRTRAVFQWARGHAKSTHMGVFIPLWLMIQEKKEVRNVITVGPNESAAIRQLSDLQRELQFNLRLEHDFGRQYNSGSWAEGEFTTKTDVHFMALGRGQKPRGVKSQGNRPDYIIVDDLDDDELCLNPDRVKKAVEWTTDALFNTQGAEGGRFIMVGNLISKTSVMSDICARPGVYITRVNVRNDAGKPSWPEMWTEERISEREQFLGFRSFQKEYMNNPINEGTVFAEMHWEEIPPLTDFPFLCCYGDPSPSNNRNSASSMKAAWLIGATGGRYYVIDGRVGRVTNAEFVDWIYDLNMTVPQEVQVFNMIENNTLQDPFYQQVFIPLFAEHDKEGRPVGISPDERRKPDKFSRIEGNLEPLNRQGRLVLNAAKKDDPHFRRLEDQFLLLTPRLPAPADGPDCIEGAVWQIQQRNMTLADGAIRLIRPPGSSRRY
jgi:hypothetical protein